jgi:hypothetical protein
MISNYKLKKIQAEVNKLHKAGSSKQKIGKYLNKEIGIFVSKGKLKEVEHDNNIETNLQMKSGLSKNRFKKIKRSIYINLENNKPIKLAEKFKPYVSDLSILENIEHSPVEQFLTDKSFKAKLIVFEWQNIKTKQKQFTSLNLTKTIKTKEDLKEVVEFEIYKKNQSAKTLRLLNISFRFFSFKQNENPSPK